MKIAAVIFDMDGVLVDSEPLHWAAMNQALGHAGPPIAEAEYREYIGDTDRHAWAAILARRGLPGPVEPYLAAYDAAVCAVMAAQAVPMPGLLPLLADLRRAGLPLAVASTSPPRWIAVTLDAIGVRDVFQAVVSGAQVPRPKPAPDIFLAAAAAVGVDPARCAVIEDSPRGLAAARAAGALTVALRHPPGSLNAVLTPADLAHADLVVDSLAALHAWWAASPWAK